MELHLQAEAAAAPEVAAALEAAGALAVTLQEASGGGEGPSSQPVLEPGPGETPLWPLVRVSGLFPGDEDPSPVLEALRRALGHLPPHRWGRLPERDWVRAWMDRFGPLRCGRRLWVCPSWAAPPPEAEVVVRLDPGLAFGTGTHPSTALCLSWLDAHPPAGLEVVDYGCGSGILALAAARLGARSVLAVDHDPQALQATAANAAANAVAGRIRTLAPEALSPRARADLVLANILAGPLQALAPRLAGLLRPGGRLVLSGILEAQALAVAEAYAPWCAMEPPRLREGWALLAGRRLPPSGATR
ncbi:MAG: 50S ribosomal protein L11 methyltransferase [Gammaproteobacteria bacterium]|nr:MAG: 50S ribosomal protein L11 methyltransferase [Gammaproteobacteria bacterium]